MKSLFKSVYLDFDLLPVDSKDPRCALAVDVTECGVTNVYHNGVIVDCSSEVKEFVELLIGQGYIADRLANIDPFTKHKQKVELDLERGDL